MHDLKNKGYMEKSETKPDLVFENIKEIYEEMKM